MTEKIHTTTPNITSEFFLEETGLNLTSFLKHLSLVSPILSPSLVLLAFVLLLAFLPILLIELFLKNLLFSFVFPLPSDSSFANLKALKTTLQTIPKSQALVAFHLPTTFLHSNASHLKSTCSKLIFLFKCTVSSCSLFPYLMTTASYFPQVQNLGPILTSSIFLILCI